MKEILSDYPYITILLALIPLFSFIYKIISTRNTLKIQSFDLLLKTYSEGNNAIHRLVVEQFFQKNFKIAANYEIISLLLSLDNPSQAIELYRKSYNYLVLENGSLRLKNKYKSKMVRFLYKYLKPFFDFILYIILGFISFKLSIYVFDDFNYEKLFEIEMFVMNIALWFVSCLMSLISLIWAIHFLIDNKNIKYVDELLPMFEKKIINKQQFYY